MPVMLSPNALSTTLATPLKFVCQTPSHHLLSHLATPSPSPRLLPHPPFKKLMRQPFPHSFLLIVPTPLHNTYNTPPHLYSYMSLHFPFHASSPYSCHTPLHNTCNTPLHPDSYLSISLSTPFSMLPNLREISPNLNLWIFSRPFTLLYDT